MIGNKIKTSELKSMLNRVQSMSPIWNLGQSSGKLKPISGARMKQKTSMPLNIVHQPSDRSRSPHKFAA